MSDSHRSIERLRCADCGAEMTRTQADVEYPECGVPNVILDSATVWRCPNGHEDFEVPHLDLLFAALADSIVVKPAVLNGAEIRFVRKHLSWGAKQFSKLIGVTDVHLSRLENGHAQPSTGIDRCVRFLFVSTQRLYSRVSLKEVTDSLMSADGASEGTRAYVHRLAFSAVPIPGAKERLGEWRSKHVESAPVLVEFDWPSAYPDLLQPFNLYGVTMGAPLRVDNASRLLGRNATWTVHSKVSVTPARLREGGKHLGVRKVAADDRTDDPLEIH